MKPNEWSYTVCERSHAKGMTRFTLLTLSLHADGDGDCFPGVETLSEEMNIPAQSVRRELARLVEMREIEVGTKRVEHGAKVYRIMLGEGREAAAPTPTEATSPTVDSAIPTWPIAIDIEQWSDAYEDKGPAAVVRATIPDGQWDAIGMAFNGPKPRPKLISVSKDGQWTVLTRWEPLAETLPD